MTDNAQKYHAVQGRTHGAGDQDTLAERAARERVYGPIAEFDIRNATRLAKATNGSAIAISTAAINIAMITRCPISRCAKSGHKDKSDDYRHRRPLLTGDINQRHHREAPIYEDN